MWVNKGAAEHGGTKGGGGGGLDVLGFKSANMTVLEDAAMVSVAAVVPLALALALPNCSCSTVERRRWKLDLGGSWQ